MNTVILLIGLLLIITTMIMILKIKDEKDSVNKDSLIINEMEETSFLADDKEEFENILGNISTDENINDVYNKDVRSSEEKLTSSFNMNLSNISFNDEDNKIIFYNEEINNELQKNTIEEVVKLSKTGLKVEEIAKISGRGIREVDIILRLQKKKQLVESVQYKK